jgi:hypothetical protein
MHCPTIKPKLIVAFEKHEKGVGGYQPWVKKTW